MFIEDLFEMFEGGERRKHKNNHGYGSHGNNKNHDHDYDDDHDHRGKYEYERLTNEGHQMNGMEKTCKNCREINSGNARFCQKCGSTLEEATYCTDCGAKMQIGAKFCSGCGKKTNN